jgi:hypothetical protein
MPLRSNGGSALDSPLVKPATAQEMLAFAEGRQTPFGLKIPKWAVPVTAIGSATGLVYAVQALITQYTAKANWYLVICGLVIQYTGTGPAPNPGDATFTVDVDRPLGDNTAGYGEKDYGAITDSLLGSFTTGPVWPVEFRISNGETIRLKILPNANMGIGVGNWAIGALIGFEWPQQGYEGF